MNTKKDSALRILDGLFESWRTAAKGHRSHFTIHRMTAKSFLPTLCALASNEMNLRAITKQEPLAVEAGVSSACCATRR
jgi:hypothetical protein